MYFHIITVDYSWYLHFKHSTAQLNYMKGWEKYAQMMKLQLALL